METSINLKELPQGTGLMKDVRDDGGDMSTPGASFQLFETYANKKAGHRLKL